MAFTLQPVKGEEFINRTELLDEIVAELKDKKSTTGYALYGTRRIGNEPPSAYQVRYAAQ